MNTVEDSGLKKKEMCCATYVYGGYTTFIPIYIFSLLKAYPDYYVKVFVHDLSEIDKKTMSAIDILHVNFAGKFEVLNSPFSRSKPNQSLRWLLGHENFIDFEYVWMSDVDFLILPEEESILSFHKKHCNRANLPFSNFIRNRNGLNFDTLSGCHFFKVDEYFEKNSSILEEISINNGKWIFRYGGKEIDLQKIHNEHLLFLLLEKSFAISTNKFLHQNNNDFPHHHGIHLGCLRSKITKHTSSVNKKFWLMEKEILELIESKEFQVLYKNIDGIAKKTVQHLMHLYKRKEIVCSIKGMYFYIKGYVYIAKKYASLLIKR